MHHAVMEVRELFPTSSTHPDPQQVAVASLPLAQASTDHSKASPLRLAAACTNCAPGSVEAQQFGDLVIQVQGTDGGQIYRGPLSALDAPVGTAENATVKVWLADTGKPQAQGVTTEWSFVTTPEN
ncbi:MAG: hypothetical protein QOK43_343 [Acidimicrobiaceae bacterium]|nr:hypothetical protein [Acidimicrobiaceae bacterium]